MADPHADLKRAGAQIVDAIHQILADRPPPILIALDGGSGSGKSALAALVAETVDATVVPGDDFFVAEVPEAAWDVRTPEERAQDCINWQRLRAEALEPLLAGKPARWQTFDFEAGLRPDGTYRMREAYEERQPAPVIILDGIYSARPELADLIDLAVLVDVPVAVRHARLAAREAADFLAAWHRRWDAAEEYYLTQVRPAASFDLVVRNCQDD